MVISIAKFFNVKRHYKIHSAKYDCYKGEWRKRKSELLKSARDKQTNMFKCGNESEEITLTLYKISHLQVRNLKLHSDGEIMKQLLLCLLKIAALVFNLKLKNCSLVMTQYFNWLNVYLRTNRNSFFVSQKFSFTTRSHITLQKTLAIKSK